MRIIIKYITQEDNIEMDVKIFYVKSSMDPGVLTRRYSAWIVRLATYLTQ
jgi:hypothetical protein